MSESSSQSTYEKLLTTFLVLAMAVAGWMPFVLESLKLPFLERFLLPASLAIAVMTLGIVYDAAERLLGGKRGLYAAAILCSIPATGMVVTDPGMLGNAALMLIVAVGIWMATRAKGEERPFFLAFIGALLAAAGYAFGIVPGVFALVFVVLLAARSGGKTIVPVTALLICIAVGAVVHEILPFGLPEPSSILPPATVTLWSFLLPQMPWSLFVLPALWMLVRRNALAYWWNDAAAAMLLVMTAALLTDHAYVTSAAAAAPLGALLGADLVYSGFREDHRRSFTRTIALPAVLTVIVLVLLPLLSAADLLDAPVVLTWHAVFAIALAAVILWTVTARLPRWTFVLLIASGILFGRIANQSAPVLAQLGEMGPERVTPGLVLLLLGAGAAVWIVLTIITRAKPRAAGDSDYRFGGQEFRLFASDPAGAPAALPERLQEQYAFAIFGDVTGAESPLSSRRSGFLAFRALTKDLSGSRYAFAVSLGDLSSQATVSAYRRLRKLLKQIPIPMVVTPGNHDTFTHNVYDPTLFHEVFGADNTAFRLGPVQFLILNNAWGSVDERQFAWIEKTLDAASAPFTLVFLHKPPFELRTDTFYAMEDRGHAERLHEIFRAHHVTAAFSGHIHSLLSETRDGVTYVISGGGGSKLTSPRDQYHYLAAEVTAAELVVRALPLGSAVRVSNEPLLELRFTPRQ